MTQLYPNLFYGKRLRVNTYSTGSDSNPGTPGFITACAVKFNGVNSIQSLVGITNGNSIHTPIPSFKSHNFSASIPQHLLFQLRHVILNDMILVQSNPGITLIT